MLEELDRAEPLAGAQPARRPRQPLPVAVAVELLEEQDLGGAAALAPQGEPGRDDPGVVDDDELVVELAWQLGEGAVPHGPVDRSYTSSRDSSRRSAGRCAIRSGGSS